MKTANSSGHFYNELTHVYIVKATGLDGPKNL